MHISHTRLAHFSTLTNSLRTSVHHVLYYGLRNFVHIANHRIGSGGWMVVANNNSIATDDSEHECDDSISEQNHRVHETAQYVCVCPLYRFGHFVMNIGQASARIDNLIRFCANLA